MKVQKGSRLAAALAGAAALSLVASPAAARGWDGWGGGHYHRHRGGVDGGDVLAGILILGGIAAIASAASKAEKGGQGRDDPRNRDWERQRPEPRYGKPRAGEGAYGAGPIGDAVDSCTDEVERSGAQVDTVDAVVREGDGWRVRGRGDDGRAFACTVDAEGRIRGVTIDGRAAWPEGSGGRYDR